MGELLLSSQPSLAPDHINETPDFCISAVDIVKNYVERDADSAAARWERFEYMLSNPMLRVHLKQD